MQVHSQRIKFRLPEPEDLDFLFEIENDPAVWSVSDNRMPYSRYSLMQYIESNTHDIFIERQVRFMIEELASGEVAGIIDLFDYNPLHHRAEVGVIVAPGMRGKGIAKEALELLCDYAVKAYGMHQLYAYVPLSNKASCRLFEACAFEKAGHLKDWVIQEGAQVDVVVYQRIFAV